MKLDIEQIRSIVFGAVRVECIEDKICMYRFTEAQAELYKERSEDFYRKTFSTAGVILEFDTDSESLGLSVEVSGGTSRDFFVHSVFAGHKRVGELSGRIVDDQSEVLCSGKYFLGAGMKRVKIQFPWSAVSKICALTLEDGAQIIPVNRKRKLILFGDSITHGYDAMKPENSYASKLVEWLDAEGVNKAIGGETFFPELAELPDDFVPDLITVAYGTNDWSHSSREVFEQSSRDFFCNLRKTYPDVSIIALAPIWRADHERKKAAGPFDSVAKHYFKLADEVEHMTVIDCVDFLPHRRDYFSDRYLHPNDEGFRFYADGLIKALGEIDRK